MNDFSINDRNNTLLKALIALRDDPSARPPSGGICYGVTVLVSREKHTHDWPKETVGVISQLLSLMMRDWPDRVEGDAYYPINGHCVSFSREDREGKIWENPLRFQLLDWLIDKLTCNGPVFVWPDREWTFKSEYSLAEFGHKGDDYWIIEHPVLDDDGELML